MARCRWLVVSAILCALGLVIHFATPSSETREQVAAAPRQAVEQTVAAAAAAAAAAGTPIPTADGPLLPFRRPLASLHQPCTYPLRPERGVGFDPQVPPPADVIARLVATLLDGAPAPSQKRVLFLGDSLARYAFASLGSAATNAGVVPRTFRDEAQAAAVAADLTPDGLESAIESDDPVNRPCNSRGGGPHVLCPDPEEAKSAIVQLWPKVMATKNNATLRLLLRSEMHPYFSSDWNASWSGAAEFAPTHVVVSRGLWDAFRLYPHDPHRFLLRFSEALVSLQRQVGNGTKVFVYGLHKVFPLKIQTESWNCLMAHELDAFREAAYCAVQRANSILSPMRIRFIDTMSLTSAYTVAMTNRKDGRHYRGAPMDHILKLILEEMTSADANVSDSSWTPPCEAAVVEEQQRDASPVLPACAAPFERSLNKEMRAVETQVRAVLGDFKASGAVGDAAVSCSALLTSIRELLGGVSEAMRVRDRYARVHGGAAFDATFPLLNATITVGASCVDFLDAAVTHDYFHAHVLPEAVPRMRYPCFDVKMIPLYQTPAARQPVFIDVMKVEKLCGSLRTASYNVDLVRGMIAQYADPTVGILACPNLLAQAFNYVPTPLHGMRAFTSPAAVPEGIVGRGVPFGNLTIAWFIRQCADELNALNATEFAAKWRWAKMNQCAALKAVSQVLTSANRAAFDIKTTTRRINCVRRAKARGRG